MTSGFPGGTNGKEPAFQCRRCERLGFDPWVGKIPWRRARQPRPVFLPGESPWTEEPGGLRFIGSQRVGHDSDYERVREVDGVECESQDWPTPNHHTASRNSHKETSFMQIQQKNSEKQSFIHCLFSPEAFYLHEDKDSAI